MLFKDQIDLVSITGMTQNELGDDIPNESKKTVFANKKDVRQSEFYQAAATGLRPELMFEVLEASYDGQETMEYQGKRYTIIRRYRAKHERIELICQGVVNDYANA